MLVTVIIKYRLRLPTNRVHNLNTNNEGKNEGFFVAVEFMTEGNLNNLFTFSHRKLWICFVWLNVLFISFVSLY